MDACLVHPSRPDTLRGVRLVDLSAPISQSPGDLPEALRTDIEFTGHEAGAAQIEGLLGVPARLLRDNEGWAVETFTRFGTHNSTHVDAPWHYNSRIRGERAQTIDELPLEWFFGPGVVLDMTAKGDGEKIDVADVEAELGRVGHELAERDIVLVYTGRDRFVDEPGYIALGPAVTAEVTLLAVRARRARDGHRRVGLGRAASPSGPGGARAGRAGHLLGRPPGRHPVLADRAAGEPRRAARDRLPGGLLPAQDRGRERRAGSGCGPGPLAPSATPAPYLHLSQMSVLNQVQDDVKTALKAGDRERVHALRLIVDALQKAEKDNGGDSTEVLQRERKRRLEAAEAYRDGGRTESAEAEEREAEVIASYLPEQLSDGELREIVGNVVAESGASSPQEMGKVMGLVMPHVKGRADGKRVSATVKEMLTP